MCQPTIRKRRRLAKIVDAAESGDSDDRTDFSDDLSRVRSISALLAASSAAWDTCRAITFE